MASPNAPAPGYLVAAGAAMRAALGFFQAQGFHAAGHTPEARAALRAALAHLQLCNSHVSTFSEDDTQC